ncbi:prepilin peptidase [Methylobacterium sp. 17Sr1-1]|uniref:A24 family peptidase n=1 Tax=Methylobacterium sp. 17Sr1-1 TaxID=2202826 RepID=UPI000D6F4EC3|nr:prepilin peptidase [Methylobacterium sp. 17Sr1-1]AWN51635.1 peptidase [Methylobacterium sp. 17Sr1-1]
MVSLCLLVVFPFLMAYAAVSDILTMTIPNRIGLALVAAFAVLAPASGLGWLEIAGHVGAGALVLAVGFVIYLRGVMGAGDVKLAAATTLWLGIGAVPEYLVATAMFGGLIALGLVLVRGHPLPGFAATWPFALRLHDERVGIPYGVALAASALVTCPAAPLWRLVLAG